MKIAVHHPTSRRGYAIPLALEKQNMLFKLYTDVHSSKWLRSTTKQLDNLTFSKLKLYDSATKRYCKNLAKEKISDLGIRGYAYNLLRSRKKSYIEVFKVGLEISDLIAQQISLCSEQIDLVYSFALSARSCRKYIPSKPVIMDQMHIPLVSLIDVLARERQIHTDWFDNSVDRYKNSEDFIISIEKEDLKSSDIIFAPSDFVKKTLIERYEFDESQILLVPYATPMWLYDFPTSVTLDNFDKKILNYTNSDEKLKLLFVGEVGIRKGIPTLLQALRKLDKRKFEARIVGTVVIPDVKVREYTDICTFMGKLNKKELAAQYQWADVFVFPSIGEGSAGVIYEAMAFGLPIITTFSSGSHVKNDVEGYIVSEGNIEELVDKITVYINDKSCLMRHSLNSANRVRDFSFEKTSIRFKEVFSKIQKLYL